MIENEKGYLSVLNDAPFSAMDRMLVKHLREDWNETNHWVLLAAALCNLSIREGHAYLDLSVASPSVPFASKEWPSLDQWESYLKASEVCSSGDGDPAVPLILADESCLYLEKYYRFEKTLSRLISERATFSAVSESDPVKRASQSPFFVITGGPGTGKTTLALRYLNLLLEQWEEQRPARFAAIAPTGKAAARLAESMSGGVARMELSDARKEQLLATPCLTIHRLLGALPHRSSFRKDDQNLLRFDVLVIDESSMIDLPLMLRLFRALPPECKILMLGDKDQLASVDVGSVFADILEASNQPESKLNSVVERLNKTYRFSEDSSIYLACQYSKNGEQAKFLDLLSQNNDDLEFLEIKKEARRLPAAALKRALNAWKALSSSESIEAALARLTDYLTLTPTRNGPFGTLEINRRIERLAREELGLDPLKSEPIHAAPLIVLENDYERDLFNGDIGLTWRDESGDFVACFQAADGSVRSFRMSELPRFESAFALTIHKSQGSEFTEVCCLFPPESNRLLTRELVYTALSRAKKKVFVCACPNEISQAIDRRATRATRLAKLLHF